MEVKPNGEPGDWPNGKANYNMGGYNRELHLWNYLGKQNEHFKIGITELAVSGDIGFEW